MTHDSRVGATQAGDIDAGDIEQVARRFLAAFNDADLEELRRMLADDAVGYVTDATGGERRIDGADSYLAAIAAMDLPSADFSVTITQPPVLVDDDRLLVMVEVRASRRGRSLHNYAAHLLRVADGRITELRMVEAKPAESDAFWA